MNPSQLLSVKAKQLLVYTQDSCRSGAARVGEASASVNKASGRPYKLDDIAHLLLDPDNLPPVSSDGAFLKEY